MSLLCRLWLLMLATGVVMTVFFGWLASAKAQDCPEGAYGCNHAQDHEQFKTWHREEHTDSDGITHPGMSCCNEHDCRPTRAYQDQEGNWHAWLGRRWAKVPPEAMLKTDILGTGRSYVCAPQGAEIYEAPPIYCFSPAQPRI